MKPYWVVLLSCLAVAQADSDVGLSRGKRFATQSCSISPESNENNVIQQNQGVTLTCNLDSEVQSCIWTHFEPMNEAQSGRSPDVLCTAASVGDNGQSCQTETRISFKMQTNQCGITISNTRPGDTGKWKLIATGLSPSLTAENAFKEFELVTYNASTVRLTDSRENPITSVDTSYNYNTKTERWETGKSDWETLEFKCQAYGGRPVPQFIWYFENNNNDPLTPGDGIQIMESILSTSDRYGFIKNMESRIVLRVDDKLKTRLEKHSINTNPSNGIVSFELRCEVRQDQLSSSERPAVRINMKKSYDDGNLTAGTIGIIVGVIVAVLLIIVAVALTLFAKSSGIWCFSDAEYGAPDKTKPKQVGTRQAQQPAQRSRRP